MADKTAIEWSDATWSPIRARNRETGGVGHFCIHVSPGCKHCYSERMQPRFGNPIRFAAQDADKVELFLDEKMLTAPLRWRRPRMVFVCSMTDLFLEGVPDEWIDRIFAVMALAERCTFQVLTKRPERMRAYFESDPDAPMNENTEARVARLAIEIARERGEDVNDPWWDAFWEWPLPNIWLGVSVEDRERLSRINHLRATPAAVRFLSLEPLLEDLGTLNLTEIDWCISGGESGPKARPAHPDWFRSIRDQCVAAGVSYFHKQNGEWLQGRDLLGTDIRPTASTQSHEWSPPGGQFGEVSYRVGKKFAGRLLDGREWNEMPG